jgi:hypothetical protein
MFTRIAAATAALVLAATASADLIPFNFVVQPQQEVPPNNTNAAGSAQLLYDTVAHTFDFDAQVFGIALGDVTGFHIHNAPPGVSGPIVINLQNLGGIFVPSGQGIRLTMNDVSIGNFEQALFAGNLYFNVHSAAFPNGQIRGQIVPAPAGLALLGLGGLVAARRRR